MNPYESYDFQGPSGEDLVLAILVAIIATVVALKLF